MGIFSNFLDGYKAWRARKTENRKEIANFLDTIAKETSVLAENLAKALELKEKKLDYHEFYGSIRKSCATLQDLFGGLTLALPDDLKLRDTLVCRLSFIIKHRARTIEKLFSVIEGMNIYLPLEKRLLYRESIPPAEKIREQITKIHEEAGRLQALAAIYRVSGKSLKPDAREYILRNLR